jgi:hypothetical protein
LRENNKKIIFVKKSCEKAKKSIDTEILRSIIKSSVALSQQPKVRWNKMSYAKLKGRIVEKFGTQVAFAKHIGLDVATVNGRLNGRSQWRADEIADACILLGIPLSDAHHYFFCKSSCEKATK